MKTRLINSQLTNFKTYLMYKQQCEMTAENVFQIEDLPKDCVIDMSYVNSQLLTNGSIAWFVDEEMGLLALPYISMSGFDVYGRPVRIQVIGQNGYSRILKRGEFVIMYDNSKRIPLKTHIVQYAERLALAQRTIDINIAQQKTPRIWKASTNKVASIKALINNIDGCENEVLGFDDLETDEGIECILQPAPFVSDKVSEQKEKLWNEFLRLVGVANLTVQKKERNIRDEVVASQGGTIAGRFNRYTPRAQAIKEIKEKFGIELTLKYYDGMPSSNEKEGEEDVYTNANVDDTNME